MWHIPDPPGLYIVDRRRRTIDLAHREIAGIASVMECPVSEGLSVWVGEFEGAASIPKGFTIAGREFRRLLDHFYLPVVPDTTLAVALFDICADAYERLVDVRRNIANIHNLLRVVLAALPSGSRSARILDFGCGTGLAAEALRTFDHPTPASVELIGTDHSEHMLQMASQRGHTVITDAELVNSSDKAFDAAIASYVVHLGLSCEDCLLIARKLRSGGLFVANYHHGGEVELAEIAARLSNVGFSPVAMPDCDAPTPRNPTLLFRAR